MAVPKLAGEQHRLWYIDNLHELEQLIEKTRGTRRIAVDVESNGMFAYQPCICTVQLAWMDEIGSKKVAIVDTLACPVHALSKLLDNPRILKVIHDISFDVRMLRQEGIDLCAVRDTSVAAIYLGKPATGLASLLESELGIHVEKTMQNSDWARRPLSEESLAYLAGDVAHLLELDSLLWQQVTQMGIEDEVATETAYRFVEALQSEIPQGPPHLRIRGYTRLDGLGLRVIESIAVQREALAEARNLPPQRVIGDKLLLTLAAHRPRTRKEMLRFGQLTRLHDEELDRILASIRQAVADGPKAAIPRAKPMPQQQVEARKGRQERLTAWRRSEARRRNIHEQVVLPTHCIRWLTAMAPVCLEGIVRMPGLGHARAERYAQRLLSILQEP